MKKEEVLASVEGIEKFTCRTLWAMYYMCIDARFELEKRICEGENITNHSDLFELIRTDEFSEIFGNLYEQKTWEAFNIIFDHEYDDDYIDPDDLELLREFLYKISFDKFDRTNTQKEIRDEVFEKMKTLYFMNKH
jgi:hypothetical protein